MSSKSLVIGEAPWDMQTDRPYSPSWVDRMTDWVEALPGPSWVTYLVLFLLAGSINQAIAWVSGDMPRGQLDIYLFLYNLFTFEVLFFFKYLDNDARRALDEFRPVLACTAEEFSRIDYELTHQPARPVILWTLVGTVLGASQAYGVLAANGETFSLSFSAIYSVVGFAIPTSLALVLGYRIVRQLRTVSRLYASASELDLFNLDPVYALSSHTAKTGLVFLLLLYTNLLLAPQSIEIPTALAITVAISALSLGAFILPLRGINQRLATAKRESLRAIRLRIKEAYELVDRKFDNNDLDEMGKLEKAIANLERQIAFVAGIPTWPWQPSTLRGFLSAMLLPLVLWSIQQLLERIFGI